MESFRNRPASSRHTILLHLIPLWLTGILFIPNIGGEYSIPALFISFVWIAPPFFLAIRLRLIDARVYHDRPMARYGTIGFLAVAGASCFYSIDPQISLQYWALTVLGFMLCAGLGHVVTGHEREVLGRFAILGTIGFIYLFCTSYSGAARFDSIRNPNSMGLMLVGLIAASLAIHWVLIRFACLTTCFYMLWATQSRSAMVAAAIILVTYFLLGQAASRRFVTLGLIVGAVLVFGLSLTPMNSVMDSGSSFITNALRLDDHYRGINTGFSGRTAIWEIAIAAWRHNPIGGIGYRVHEYYPGLDRSTHNAYLALLVETGVLGTLFVFLIVSSGLRELLTQVRQGSKIARLGLSLVAGFLFISFFERYLFNFGTPTSILVLMFLLIPTPYHLSSRPDRHNIKRILRHSTKSTPLLHGT
jgi:O-antigen ligase